MDAELLNLWLTAHNFSSLRECIPWPTILGGDGIDSPTGSSSLELRTVMAVWYASSPCKIELHSSRCFFAIETLVLTCFIWDDLRVSSIFFLPFFFGMCNLPLKQQQEDWIHSANKTGIHPGRMLIQQMKICQVQAEWVYANDLSIDSYS